MKNGDATSAIQLSSDLAVLEAKDVDTLKLFDTNVPLAVHSFGLTDTGKVRESNEDQFLIATLHKALQIERTSLPQPKVQRSSDRVETTNGSVVQVFTTETVALEFLRAFRVPAVTRK